MATELHARAGVSVSTITRSAIAINPEGEEADALRGWWDATGCSAVLTHAGEGLASALKCARTFLSFPSTPEMHAGKAPRVRACVRPTLRIVKARNHGTCMPVRA